MSHSTPDPVAFLRAAVQASVATVYAEHALTAEQISRLDPPRLWQFLTRELWWHTPNSNEEFYGPAVQLMETILTSGLKTGVITFEALKKVVGTREPFDFLRHAMERNPLVAKKTLSSLLTCLEFRGIATAEEVYRDIIPKRVFVDIATLQALFEKLLQPLARMHGWDMEKPAPSSGGGTLPLGSKIETPRREARTLISGGQLEDAVTSFAGLFPTPSDPPPDPLATPLVRRKSKK